MFENLKCAESRHRIRNHRGFSRWPGASLLILFAASIAFAEPSPSNDERGTGSPDAVRDAGDELIVDCLLSGQVRKMGTRLTYLTAPRSIRTTVTDCEIRGGQVLDGSGATSDSTETQRLEDEVKRLKETTRELQHQLEEVNRQLERIQTKLDTARQQEVHLENDLELRGRR